jgi:hypothetical protein
MDIDRTAGRHLDLQTQPDRLAAVEPRRPRYLESVTIGGSAHFHADRHECTIIAGSMTDTETSQLEGSRLADHGGDQRRPFVQIAKGNPIYLWPGVFNDRAVGAVLGLAIARDGDIEIRYPTSDRQRGISRSGYIEPRATIRSIAHRIEDDADCGRKWPADPNAHRAEMRHAAALVAAKIQEGLHPRRLIDAAITHNAVIARKHEAPTRLGGLPANSATLAGQSEGQRSGAEKTSSGTPVNPCLDRDAISPEPSGSPRERPRPAMLGCEPRHSSQRRFG